MHRYWPVSWGADVPVAAVAEPCGYTLTREGEAILAADLAVDAEPETEAG